MSVHAKEPLVVDIFGALRYSVSHKSYRIVSGRYIPQKPSRKKGEMNGLVGTTVQTELKLHLRQDTIRRRLDYGGLTTDLLKRRE